MRGLVFFGGFVISGVFRVLLLARGVQGVWYRTHFFLISP